VNGNKILTVIYSDKMYKVVVNIFLIAGND